MFNPQEIVRSESERVQAGALRCSRIHCPLRTCHQISELESSWQPSTNAAIISSSGNAMSSAKTAPCVRTVVQRRMIVRGSDEDIMERFTSGFAKLRSRASQCQTLFPVFPCQRETASWTQGCKRGASQCQTLFPGASQCQTLFPRGFAVSDFVSCFPIPARNGFVNPGPLTGVGSRVGKLGWAVDAWPQPQPGFKNTIRICPPILIGAVKVSEERSSMSVTARLLSAHDPESSRRHPVSSDTISRPTRGVPHSPDAVPTASSRCPQLWRRDRTSPVLRPPPQDDPAHNPHDRHRLAIRVRHPDRSNWGEWV